jgi:thymidylate synthase
MHLEKDTLDDLLNDCLVVLLNESPNNSASRGSFTEQVGASLELRNPRARLSASDTKGKAFSALGELLWYMSGSESVAFITNYVDAYKDEQLDGDSVYGAYGPRLYKSYGQYNQLGNVLNILQQNPTSRKAVIQLFEARDVANLVPGKRRSAPCTCSLQFLLRNGKLHMITYMRSNDAFLGLSHDIFAFTMIQEYYATALNVDLGVYKHFVGSLHLYDRHYERAKEYLKEGYQSTKYAMPHMPAGNQWNEIEKLIKLEEKIRLGEVPGIETAGLSEYWKDLAYLLAFYKCQTENDISGMQKIKEVINESTYQPILVKRIRSLQEKIKTPNG